MTFEEATMFVGTMVQRNLKEALDEDKALFDKLLKILIRENEPLVRDILKGLVIGDPSDLLVLPISEALKAIDSKKTR